VVHDSRIVRSIAQVTVFVSLLTLDTRRMEAHRADLVPCLVIPPASQPLHARRAYGGVDDADGGNSQQAGDGDSSTADGSTQRAPGSSQVRWYAEMSS
jgi:hypothetical protein